jgi:hypothetical protein
MRRLRLTVLNLVVFGSILAAAPSYAQQSLNFSIGGFVPRGEDARTRVNGQSGDVLVNNLDFLAFRIKDFNGPTISGEYSVGLGEWIDASLGVGFYRRTVPSVYLDLVNEDGTEIEQDLRLRIVPWTATIRFLPLGRSAPVQPYIGGGVGVFQWRYTESGQFVGIDGTIFRDSFVGSGTTAGPVILGGVRFPVGPWTIGGEVKYQRAEGDLPADQEFSAAKIDLGGWTYAATFGIRF